MSIFWIQSHKIADLVRSAPGTTGFYICNGNTSVSKGMAYIASYATRIGGSVKQNKVLVIDPFTKEVSEGIFVEVVRTGRERLPKGRKQTDKGER